MALAGRSSRRAGGGRRVLILAVIITLVVLVVDASIKSRSPGPVRQLAAEAWIDQTLPLIRESTAQGQQVAALVTEGLQMSASAIAGQAGKTATAAQATYDQALRLGPPSATSAAAGLLDACLLVRWQAATSVAKTVMAALSGPDTQAAAAASSAALIAAAQSFQVADKAYQLFSQNLPGLGFTPPASVWAADLSLYQNPRLTVYLQALRNAKNLTPTHLLEVVSLATQPQAESLQGSIQVLPPTPQISVALVVANAGNQTERTLTVTAAISPSTKAPSAREFVESLAPGTDRAITIGLLYPPQGVPVTLTVTVSGPPGSPTPPASQTLTFEMPAPNIPIATTTTTTPPVGAGPVPVPGSGSAVSGGTVPPSIPTTPQGV